MRTIPVVVAKWYSGPTSNILSEAIVGCVGSSHVQCAADSFAPPPPAMLAECSLCSH